MTQKLVERECAPRTDPRGQPDALFLARLAVEEQRRFTRRLVAGLTALLLLWLAGLWYFKQPSLSRWWQARMDPPPVAPERLGDASRTAQVERLNLELSRLQKRLGRVVTQTLGMKLNALEERIRLGRAGLQDLELIESIKEDVRLLAREGARQPVSASQSVVAAAPVSRSGGAPGLETDLLERFGRLEALFYLTLGSLALVAIAAGGYWFRCSVQLKRLDADLSQLRGPHRSA